MTVATTSGAELNAALKPQLKVLVEDMRARLTDDEVGALAQWRATYDEARKQERTAVSWTDWSEDQLTQAAVGWLLTSVFVRFCEDNLLLGDTGVWIASPDHTLRQRALDAENSFYRSNPDASYREWLQVAFDELGAHRATEGLVDSHAAIHIFAPSSDAVQRLLEFWRATDDDGVLLWSFADPELETRFLGDLYQDLSDFAKKKYALLQTPVFVEEFILDQTMEPALNDRPLDGFKLVDPTCGSGHFLLGAFQRLLGRWRAQAPAMEPRALADKALGSIYGVDLNPFAVSIAQFRLLVAAMQASGDSSLIGLPAFTLNVINGDSLLHGPDSGGRDALDYGDAAFDKDAVVTGFAYSTEDRTKLAQFLASGQYDCVVGNPPYITVKDKALNARYREIYHYCKGTYALTVPFMERFFALAKPGDNAGWVGQITSNSFMKREFGVPLIEKFLANIDLRLVIDTSGAYIPGHGTPTVILVGRNHGAVTETVRAVLGIQGEPGAPKNPAQGTVWSSITSHTEQPGFEDQWISVTDLPISNLAVHPWSLSGGGAVELLAAINLAGSQALSETTTDIGFMAVTREDDAFDLGAPTLRRLGIEQQLQRPFVGGSSVRDWCLTEASRAMCPYGADGNAAADEPTRRALWPVRPLLRIRRALSGTQEEQGLEWWEYSQLNKRRFTSELLIAFPFVSTHNHFYLARNSAIFIRTAPVIKLPEGATEDEHLRLLGILNSSTACFWLKQNSHSKGNATAASGMPDQPWSWNWEFTGTTLKDFPLPQDLPLTRARYIDELAQRLALIQPDVATIEALVHSPSELLDEDRELRSRLISEQEELDWETYYHYGLTTENLSFPTGTGIPITAGLRSFEIVMARNIRSGIDTSKWFSHANHQHPMHADFPTDWPQAYRDLIQRRVSEIESNPFIRLLEKPEYKRRWAGESWGTKVERAVRNWLLDSLEDKSLWFTPQGTPQPLSVAELAARVETNSEFITALDMWAGQKDAPVTKTLEKLLKDEAVPFLAELRYKPSGLRKRAEWEKVWELQRQEDAGLVKAEDIPVPPKYTSADFKKPSYWQHRGKLDVPKERFISYPGLGRATDPTSLLGWAGWNHAYQGLALALIFAGDVSDGAKNEYAVAAIQSGINEILPFVRQYHSLPDPALSANLADYLQTQLSEMAIHARKFYQPK
ncbi:BREX-2 system adenine-specific DNA-methyltransferase PglX [Tsukamurella sp. M9C]|uniref:BREX-2 system adenine-specific DNA-methyltransferase PglX n=1 Tax=Tsukamurella sp. M9C TaxID=2877520 RepID=UPI001CC90D05|nr:BREX-2 system adenine-specific DNA-methyltransferase PglX [Tsukamurella sp. M9C]MCA0156403.1 BREX-2 system adenine-specific DNA-methyltransferase PglX [Tsukamurella sp. M9C]